MKVALVPARYKSIGSYERTFGTKIVDRGLCYDLVTGTVTDHIHQVKAESPKQQNIGQGHRLQQHFPDLVTERITMKEPASWLRLGKWILYQHLSCLTTGRLLT